MMNSQRSNTEKYNLNEEGKKIGINKVINNSLKPQIRVQKTAYKMKSNYLKFKKRY